MIDRCQLTYLSQPILPIQFSASACFVETAPILLRPFCDPFEAIRLSYFGIQRTLTMARYQPFHVNGTLYPLSSNTALEYKH